MPERVLIQYDACRMVLYLPAFFDGSTLERIRKLFKLLSKRPHQNAIAFETLDRFFPAWEEHFEMRVILKNAGKRGAEEVVRAAESQVACFGTMATDEMKSDLLYKQRELKKADLEAKRAKSALERCGKIKNAYNEILR